MINKNSRINKHWHLHHAYVHTHGAIDPSVFTTQRGIWAIKWSFFGLLATAISSVFLFLLQSSESYGNLARVFLPAYLMVLTQKLFMKLNMLLITSNGSTILLK